MKVDEIKEILVVGGGLMGTGIVQVCAQAGYKVYLNEDAQLSSVKVEFIVMNDRVKEKDW